MSAFLSLQDVFGDFAGGDKFRDFRGVRLVAFDAVFIENRLNLAFKTVSSGRAVEGRDLDRVYLRRDRARIGRSGRILGLVAADAGDRFARFGGDPAAHDLDRVSVLVERLERDWDVGGYFERGGSVFENRHGSDNAARIPRAVEPDAVRLGAHALIGELIAEDAQRFDFSARNPFESFAFVNIGDKDVGGRGFRIDAVGQNRLAFGFTERNRLDERGVRIGQDRHDVVVDIGQADFPRGLRGPLAGDQKESLGDRVRMHELRPALRDWQVARDRLDLFAVAGDALNRAGRLFTALRRIENNHVAHTVQLVMARNDPDELRGVARQRPRGKDAVRPVGTASVKLGLIRAVRVHVEHNAREAVRQVDVFPAQVHDAPVVHDDGVPVVVLFDRELADRAVKLLNIQVADVSAAVNAGYARHTRGGAEDHAVVGQIAAVVIIDVGVVNEGRKFGLLLRGVPVFVEREFPEPPAVRREVGRREHNFRRVVVEFQIADEFAVCRLIDEFIFALEEVKAAEFVAVARLRQDGIAVVVFRQTHLIRIAANVQERGEVQVGRAEYDVELKGIVVGLQRGDLFVEAVFFPARDRFFDFL